MTIIKLTAEQAAVFANAKEPVRVCLPDGSIAGWVSSTMHLRPLGTGFTPEEVAQAERRLSSPGPAFTTAEVLSSLRDVERS